MNVFNLVLHSENEPNQTPMFYAFEYDAKATPDPMKAIKAAVSEYLSSPEYQRDKEYLGETLGWTDAMFSIPEDTFEKHGLFLNKGVITGALVSTQENLALQAVPSAKDEKEKPLVTIYTDGSCMGNPGPGGWGAVLCVGGKEKELCGNSVHTTNNRMELMAVISSLAALKVPSKVTIYSDSKYVVDSITKNWVEGWKKRGWKNSSGDPTPNTDLWELLTTLLKKHDVTFNWVKGHAGNPLNERCDKLATQQSAIAAKESDNQTAV